MTTNIVTEERDETQQTGGDWRPAPELAPSSVRPAEPWLARWIGMFGLFFVLVGAVAWVVNAAGRQSLITAAIGPGLAAFLVLVGLGGLLIHAALDKDLQVRRMYMGLGYVWLATGVIISLVRFQGQFGGLFLPFGFTCLVLALLFLLTFTRHETEPLYLKTAERVVGGVGALMALAGFGYGNVSVDFLVPNGFVLILLGLLYWWAFESMVGAASDLGYRGALAMGAVGLLAFVVALGRSALPSLFASWGWISSPTSFVMPSGLLLMGGGLVYLAFAAALASDHPLVVLTRRELASFFFSPLAYIVLIGFIFIAWQLFMNFVYEALWTTNPLPGHSPANPQIEPVIAGYIIAWFPIICVIFVVPVLTMRLLSEEQRTGTLEVMLTAPVGETTVVLSKFLAAFIFFMLVWLPFGLNLVSLRAEGGQPFDYRPILSFFIALAFTGAGFVSMGLFFSSLTRNQVASAILTFVGMLLLTFIFFPKRSMPVDDVRRIILTHISYIDLWIKSLEGKLAPRDLFYHLSAAVVWLFMTVKVLESRKWR